MPARQPAGRGRYELCSLDFAHSNIVGGSAGRSKGHPSQSEILSVENFSGGSMEWCVCRTARLLMAHSSANKNNAGGEKQEIVCGTGNGGNVALAKGKLVCLLYFT